MGTTCGKAADVDDGEAVARAFAESNMERYESSPSPMRGNRQYYSTVRYNGKTGRNMNISRNQISHFGTMQRAPSTNTTKYDQTTWKRSSNLNQSSRRRQNNSEDLFAQDVNENREETSSPSRSTNQVSTSLSQNIAELSSKSMDEFSPASQSSVRVRDWATNERSSLYGTFSLRTAAFQEFYQAPKMFNKYSKYQYLTESQMSQPHLEKLLLSEIKCPKHESALHWQMRNTVHFYEVIRVLYYRVSRVCTKQTCPMMTAGRQFTFKWQHEDGVVSNESAPDYMDLLFDWIENLVVDTNVFPCADSFSAQSKKSMSTILRRIFRVFAHLYCVHFERIESIGLKSELNIRFQHFCYFVLLHKLVHHRDLHPLKPLILRTIAPRLISGFR